LDVVDPVLSQVEWCQGVEQSLIAAGIKHAVHLHAGSSPHLVQQIAEKEKRRWSLIFVDGDHENIAPLLDAVVSDQYAEADAMILFHDLNSPSVGLGLDYLRGRGWKTVVYQTTQVMGAAWRGRVEPVRHHPDPAIKWEVPRHLQRYSVSPEPLQNPTDSNRDFFTNLIQKTQNFSNITWLGQPIWQNILDLWTTQETIAQIKPDLLIECGTNRGGAALFYAHLFDLLGKGRVLTIDVQKLHSLSHPRIGFIQGSSVAEEVLRQVRAEVSVTTGAIMVILDSDHSKSHVSREMEAYADFVTPGSFMLVQDGVIDELPIFKDGRPGPLPAIQEFLTRRFMDFEVDRTRGERFLISHHPLGWLRRKKNMVSD
jgi:cephalosporin hydroxylase